MSANNRSRDVKPNIHRCFKQMTGNQDGCFVAWPDQSIDLAIDLSIDPWLDLSPDLFIDLS
jgi:hypothetical protein